MIYCWHGQQDQASLSLAIQFVSAVSLLPAVRLICLAACLTINPFAAHLIIENAVSIVQIKSSRTDWFDAN